MTMRSLDDTLPARGADAAGAGIEDEFDWLCCEVRSGGSMVSLLAWVRILPTLTAGMVTVEAFSALYKYVYWRCMDDSTRPLIIVVLCIVETPGREALKILQLGISGAVLTTASLLLTEIVTLKRLP